MDFWFFCLGTLDDLSFVGLGFRPMPDDKYVESTLIWFKHGNDGDWKDWVDRLNVFLES